VAFNRSIVVLNAICKVCIVILMSFKNIYKINLYYSDKIIGFGTKDTKSLSQIENSYLFMTMINGKVTVYENNINDWR